MNADMSVSLVMPETVSGAGKLRNLGAGGAPSSQILRALTKIYGPSMILFRT